MLKVEEMKALLKGYDLNSDGFLTPHEVITSVVKSKGEDYIPTADEEDFFEMLKSFTNDDGRVKIKKVTGAQVFKDSKNMMLSFKICILSIIKNNWTSEFALPDASCTGALKKEPKVA